MRPILALLFIALLAAGQPASAATPADTKRAFEIADLYRVASVGVPEISRDGSRVAFSVNRYDLPAGESWSEIWMMAPDGSGLRQMTFGRHGDSSPSFSPDGKTLLFVSDQSGESQLHLLPIDGGESRQLTHFPLGVSDPLWSPDGRTIAVTSRVFPECGADAKCNEKLLGDLSEGKLKVRVADALLYRHWTDWREGRYSHILLVDATTGDIVKDLTPGPWDSPVFQAGGGRGFSFSPDGKQLVYASDHDKYPASSTNSDLWMVDVTGKPTEKSAVNLTASNEGWDGAPLFSPDGRSIAFRSQETARYESDLFRLALYDRQAKKTIYLTDRKSFDNWVDDMAWLPDSQGLLFEGEYQGRTPLYRIDLKGGLAGGAPQKILTHDFLDGFRVTPDGRSVLYMRRAIAAPHEIYRATISGAAATPQRLTRFNSPLETDVDIRPAEEMWVDAGAYKVHVFVIKPHGFDPAKKYPLILNVHGGPQSQWADSFRGDWQVYPGKGYIVAFANPTGSTGYGQSFTDAIACDWGGRVYQDLMKVTDALEKLPYVDKDRMGAMGWSFGGYMMMWFEGHTQRFKAIASMMGLFDLPSFYTSTEELWFPEKDLCGAPWSGSEAYAKWSPSNFVSNFKTPALVLTGENDLRVPYTQSLGFFTALQKQNVPSRLVVYPNAGHWPGWKEMVFYYNAHLDWFHKWLGGGAAPYDLDELARNRAFGKEGGWTKK